MYVPMYMLYASIFVHVFNVNHIFKAIKYENCGYNYSKRLLPLESRINQSRAEQQTKAALI